MKQNPFKILKEDLQEVFFLVEHPELFYDHVPSECTDMTDTLTFYKGSTICKYLSNMGIPVESTDIDRVKLEDLRAFISVKANQDNITTFYDRIDLIMLGLEKDIKRLIEDYHSILLNIIF